MPAPSEQWRNPQRKLGVNLFRLVLQAGCDYLDVYSYLASTWQRFVMGCYTQHCTLQWWSVLNNLLTTRRDNCNNRLSAKQVHQEV